MINEFKRCTANNGHSPIPKGWVNTTIKQQAANKDKIYLANKESTSFGLLITKTNIVRIKTTLSKTETKTIEPISNSIH